MVGITYKLPKYGVTLQLKEQELHQKTRAFHKVTL